MTLRTFVDSVGIEWQAYDVVPRPEERRRLDRRSNPKGEGAATDRRAQDRRITVGRRSSLTKTGVSGWLCFDRGEERRRLSPIPADWRRCSEAALEQYCQSAQPTRKGETANDRR